MGSWRLFYRGNVSSGEREIHSYVEAKGWSRVTWSYREEKINEKGFIYINYKQMQLLAFRIVQGEETIRPIADFHNLLWTLPTWFIYVYFFRKKNSYIFLIPTLDGFIWFSFMLLCPSLAMLPAFLCRFITSKLVDSW